MKVERAIVHPEQEDRDGEAKVTDPVDKKGLLGGPGCLWFCEPETDQQIAAGTHRLPEDIDQQKVTRGHQHRHREDKHRHEGKKSWGARIIVHVAGRIDGDEQSDAGDDGEHCGGQRVEPQRHRDREVPDVLPRGEVLRREQRIGGRAAGGGRVGAIKRRPLPERGDHFDGPHRLGMNSLERADVTGSRHQQRNSDDRRAGDANNGRQVRPGSERASQQNGENRACQGQQRHGDQQR